jgi:uncharacterized protein
VLHSTTTYILAVIFIATLIRATLGFGEALVAVPLLALRIPIAVAAPLAVAMSVVVAAIIVAQDWRSIHVRSAGWLIVAALPGIPLGLLLLTRVNDQIVKLILGLLIVGFSLYSLSARNRLHLKQDHKMLLLGAGFCSGILGGAYGMNAPPLVIYGAMRRWSPQHFRATLQAYFLPVSLAGLLGYAASGLVAPAVMRYFLLSLPGVIVAVLLGRFLNRRLRSGRFFAFIYIGLIATGGALVVQAILSRSTTHAPIREFTAAGHRYAIVDLSLKQSNIELYWKKSDGSRIGTLGNLNAIVSDSGKRLLFATNAGIFDSNLTPMGLFVEDRRTLAPLNLNGGSGNFFLQPNGIFLIDADGAAIIESSSYSKRITLPRLATQSGPLLLIDGQINPQLSADSTSRKIRSGVGVISPDHIIFALSRDPVTFHEFASLFRDEQHCQSALYLDGEISRFYPDPAGRQDQQENFAGMFAVTERK